MTRAELAVLNALRRRRQIILHADTKGRLSVRIPWLKRRYKLALDATLSLVGYRYAGWGFYSTYSHGRDTPVHITMSGKVAIEAMLRKSRRAA